MDDFERRFGEAVRDPSKPDQDTHTFRGGTITLGKRVNEWQTFDTDGQRVAVVKAARAHLERIATARHWLFHNTGATINVLEVLEDMVAVLHKLDGVADPTATLNTGSHTGPPKGWRWHEHVTADRQITVALEITGHGMSLPLPRDACLVGRDAEVAAVTAAVIRRGARVRLLHHCCHCPTLTLPDSPVNVFRQPLCPLCTSL
jgi:hypothetical protein